MPSKRKPQPDYAVSATRFGFDWGPAAVYRLMDDPCGGVVIEVAGEKERVEIRVTPAGMVRVYSTKKNTKDYFRSIPR